MHEIAPNLYLGDLKDAQDIKNLQKLGISHILTLDVAPLSTDVSSNFVTKWFEIEDSETANILTIVEDCLKFIEDAVKNDRKVLVHCHAGVSRSAAIVAAYTMKKNKQTLSEVMENMRKIKPEIEINNGFVKQLLLFETMGWKVDVNHPAYRHYKFKMLQRRVVSEGHEGITASLLADNPGSQKSGSGDDNYIYRCKKCRKAVFRQNNVYPHEIDEAKAFHSKVSEIHVPVKCSSLFLEPIKWMEKSVIAHLDGRLDCPFCHFRLGRFNWAGNQCSCGKWVTPAMQIHMSNVDKTWPN